MVDIEAIRAFSNASSSYEANAYFQNACAQDVLTAIDMPSARSVLDVGCGTGVLTRLLADRFPGAQILACDPSQTMLQEAQQITVPDSVKFACCGVHDLPEGCWDLIASNAALHWAGDHTSTLAALKSRLAPGGMLAFSYFTQNTYPELTQVLSLAVGFEVKLPSAAFASVDELEATLSRLFSDVRMQENVCSRDFADLRELFEHIRLTGTRGSGVQPKLRWTRKLLERTQQEYLAQFGDIRASYEVVICTARQTQSS